MLANNKQFIGFSLEIGPEVEHVLDWHDGNICGKEVMHKETGRIYRITPKRPAEDWDGRYTKDLKKMSDLDLAKLMPSKVIGTQEEPGSSSR